MVLASSAFVNEHILNCSRLIRGDQPQYLGAILERLKFENRSLDLLQFRMRVLRGGLIAAIGVTTLVIVMIISGVLKFPFQQIVNNVIFLFVSVACYLSITVNDRSFHLARFCHLVSMVVFFGAGCIYYPSDKMRYAWFFICVGSAFLMGGTWAGVICTVACLVGIHFAQSQSTNISTDEAGTISCAIVCTSILFCIFEKHARDSLASLRAASLKLHDLAHTDSLTGLANRMAFEKVLASVMLRPKACSLVIMDLDHFKKVNDVYGHPMGDEVLRAVAEVLIKTSRPRDFVARIGGEEFVILLPDTELPEAELVIEGIRQSIAETSVRFGDVRLSVTASFGIAYSAFAKNSTDELKRSADGALYQAKNCGRNCVHIAASDSRRYG